MKHRSFNYSVAYLGVMGSGKTDAAVRRVLELAKTPAYVLAHDGSFAIPDSLHDGEPVAITRYDSLRQAAAALASNPSGIHAFSSVPLHDLMEFACKLACASLGAQAKMSEGAQLSTPQGGRGEGPPVVLYIDEAVMASEMRANHIDPAFRELITQRRHKHVGIVWGTQTPGFVHHQALQLGSEVVLFRCVGDQAMSRLRDAAIPDEIIARVQDLPDHESITFKIGSRLVAVPPEPRQDDADEADDDETPADRVIPEPTPVPAEVPDDESKTA